MSNIQKKLCQGITGQITGNTPTRVCALPEFPANGSAVIGGYIVATDPTAGGAGHTVAFTIDVSVNCFQGTVTHNTSAFINPDPADAGLAALGAALAVQFLATGQQAEIEVTGAAGKTLVWSWDLQVSITTLS